MQVAPEIVVPKRSQNLRYGFKLAGVKVVPAARVLTEVVANAQIFRVPKSVATLVGVLNLRGFIVPVVDAAAIAASVTDIRPSQRRALVFDRDAASVGLLIQADPEMVALVAAPEHIARPQFAFSAFLTQAWAQEDQPSTLWWELDHRAAFDHLAKHSLPLVGTNAKVVSE
jgi:chemotaxis signal transduction protein